MAYLWHELRRAVPLITSGNDYIWSVTWVTIQVAAISTALALAAGLPIGVALGIGRVRGRRALQVLANASLALPPVVVGVWVLLLTVPEGVFGSLRMAFTLRGVIAAQTILALPYVAALTPAAIQGLPAGLLSQARALGAGRRQAASLVLREARIGVLAAAIAALGASLAEVGAVVIVGGNVQSYDQTLASAALAQVNDYADYPYALAIGIVLLALILVLTAILTLLQQRTSGIHLRFRMGV
jgi:tungstate transport system permease protein